MTLLLVGFLLPVVAVSAVLCGHVGEAWPPGVWWRAWRAAGPRKPATAPLAASQPSSVPESLTAPERRTEPRVPSWANNRTDSHKEVA